MEVVTIALKTTWAGWKMEKSNCWLDSLEFLNASINNIPRNEPRSVNGEWPLSSARMCLAFSFVCISFFHPNSIEVDNFIILFKCNLVARVFYILSEIKVQRQEGAGGRRRKG